jgi:TonB C terminal
MAMALNQGRELPRIRDHKRNSNEHCSSVLHKGSIEVTNFLPHDRGPLLDPRGLASVVAAAVSVLLHLVIVTTAVWKSGREQIPSRMPSFLSAQASTAVAMQWVMIDETAISEGTDNLAALVSAPRLSRIKVSVDFQALAAEFDDDSPPPNDSGVSAQLFASYVAQISARIDRAWTQPRTPIGSFNCQVRIEQDTAGNVVEVLLERCNGSSVWQLSLVQAIQSASPLPAPADPSVFVHAIHLNFRAQLPEPGVSPDPYEHASIAARWVGPDRTTSLRQGVVGHGPSGSKGIQLEPRSEADHGGHDLTL